jgi:hypothetical protein
MSSIVFFRVVAAGLVSLGAAALAGGCGSSAPDLSTELAFCQAVANADCSPAAVQACYLPSAATTNSDTQRCIGFRSTPERCNPLNLPYHAAYAQPCLDAHTALYASAMLDPHLFQDMNSKCAAVFNRGGKTGARCTIDTDCDVGGGLSCVVHGNGEGTCQTPQQVSPGNSCNSLAAECATGYHCESSGFCVQNPGAGKACGAGVPCGTLLRCVMNGSGATSGICAAQLADQSPCTQDGDCKGGFCVAVTATSNVCAGQPAPLAFDTPACSLFTAK